MAESVIAEVLSAKYVLLTTFKRDGSAVPTPVWAVADGPAVLVWTQCESGKVKRIRRSRQVTVAPCTARGRVTGEVVEATATLLGAAGTVHVQEALIGKYGPLARILVRRAVRRRGQDSVIGIRVDLAL